MSTAQTPRHAAGSSEPSWPRHAMHPSHDFLEYLREYAREKPDVVALWCFGIGFILGWKLKPW